MKIIVIAIIIMKDKTDGFEVCTGDFGELVMIQNYFFQYTYHQPIIFYMFFTAKPITDNIIMLLCINLYLF